MVSKLRPGECDVAEGPEPLVGEPVVITLFHLLGQPHPAQGVARSLRRNLDVILFIDGQSIRVGRAVGDPHSARRSHHGVERRGHPAGRSHTLDRVAREAVLYGSRFATTMSWLPPIRFLINS